MDFLKGWPVQFLPVPAFSHKIVDLLWAVGWLGQVDLLGITVEVVAAVLNDLLIVKVLERLFTGIGEHLP